MLCGNDQIQSTINHFVYGFHINYEMDGLLYTFRSSKLVSGLHYRVL